MSWGCCGLVLLADLVAVWCFEVVLCFGFWFVAWLVLVIDLDCVFVNSADIMLLDYLYVDLLFGISC